MNRALFSKAFLVPVAVAWPGLMLLVSVALPLLGLAGGPKVRLTPGTWAAATFLYAFLGCFLHEKIARCDSSLFERAARFGSFYFLVSAAPLLAVALTAWGAEATAVATGLGLVVSIVAFAAPIHLLYRFDPKGGSRYFSLSQKFQVDGLSSAPFTPEER